jgi:hypothetical protein
MQSLEWDYSCRKAARLLEICRLRQDMEWDAANYPKTMVEWFESPHSIRSRLPDANIFLEADGTTFYHYWENRHDYSRSSTYSIRLTFPSLSEWFTHYAREQYFIRLRRFRWISWY